jgi:DNA polymerase III delta prime subunit
MSQLTDHQREKLEDIKHYIHKGEKHILLKGSAGVGKTFLVGELIKYLEMIKNDRKFEKVLCSAPTHKALSVLIGKISSDITFNTLHSALHYKAMTDKQTGEKIFVSTPSEKYPPLKRVKYWVIDEASMVDSVMLDNIIQHARLQDTTVIYVGDEKQINPVGEDNSPVFIQEFPEIELTEIIRQGPGNPIISLSRSLNLIDFKQSNLIHKPEKEDTGYLFTDNLAKIIEELSKVNGSDEFKYLAWTNKEVDKINSLVRHRVYGDHPAKIELGESIIINKAYKDYKTNEEVVVHNLERKKVTLFLTLKNTFKEKIEEAVDFSAYVVNEDIYILEDSSTTLFKKYAAIMNKNCKEKTLDFETRNKFLDTFVDFKYNHALTVHKSQGSTYKNVVLNVKDIKFNTNLKEVKRLLYTGVTRASDLLILYNV